MAQTSVGSALSKVQLGVPCQTFCFLCQVNSIDMTGDPDAKNSELIGKLIQKRKDETEAFKKLLTAIEDLGEQTPGQPETIISPKKGRKKGNSSSKK